MGSPLPPGFNSGGFSNVPNPTGSSANFSSQGCADSTLQQQTQLRRTCGGQKGGRRTKRKRELNRINGGAQRS
ncbi:hypothetical protein C4D60_Mb05t29280 [Musa balbisiana]|uniref:Uncharacterized protein n=1 Tax=Musa balbisiana TaxID=52838 RepID=A0A4S8JZR5_MUSBA|nr:hypothetical protein C4D60_Mb05t29280 [Musa balbisiana]